MGRSCNTSKGNACTQVCRKLPLKMDAFIAILRAHRENVHANFHCGVCATFVFCIKSQVELKCPLIFLCNPDVCACTMRCKRGFKPIQYFEKKFPYDLFVMLY